MQTGGRARPVVGVVAGAVVAVALLGALVALLSDRDPAAPDQATPASVPAPSGPDGPALEVIVPSFGSGTLADVTGDYRFAYVTREGIAMIDPTSATSIATTLPISDLPPPNVFTELPRLGLLTNERTTYGLTDEARPTVYELYTRGRIIAGSDETMTMFAEDDDDLARISVGTALGFSVSATEVPNGSRTLAVPGLGLLVSPPTGRTFIARPTKLELLSEHLIVAASATSHVELRCDIELRCRAWLVERATANATQLPEAFGRNRGALSVSPDGRWVTLTNAEVDQIVDGETGSVTLLGATAKGPVSWAPDSSFAAWFDRGAADTRLEVLAPRRGQTESIDLAEFDAASPLTESLLLF